MRDSKKESFFWASYADLMTSLFFIMLVLFVLAIAMSSRKSMIIGNLEGQLTVSKETERKIKEIETAIQNIDPKYFEYKEEYKKHILKIPVKFPIAKSDFSFISAATKLDLRHAGNSIEKFVLKNSKYDVQYLLIIEGQASKDNYFRNSELSYERALALKRLWDNSGILFGSNCEVIISGSGIAGKMRESSEELNQRFLIHIIPKPGIINNSL